MSSLSEEDENYVRMSMLLIGLSQRAVRALFDREFPPTSLLSALNQKYKTLLSLQKSKVINQAQWNLLFPPGLGVPDSKTFDVTLMICLIRNLTSVILPATGFDCLPSTRDTTPGADLARIKYYRNKLAHLFDPKIHNSDFTTAWNDISDAVGRLGGSSMYTECQNLRTKILDPSILQITLEITKELTEVKTSVQNLESNQVSVTKEVQGLKCDHEHTIDELVMVKAHREQNMKEVEMLTFGVEQNAHELEELKMEHEQKGIVIEKLKANQELMAKEIEILQTDHEQKTKEMEMLKTGNENKTAEIEQLKTEHTKREIEMEKLKAKQELKEKRD